MPGGDSWAALARAIGATPVPIAFTEVYMALRTGTVDGQENALPTVKSNSFHELLDQIVLTNHLVWNLHLAVNADRWNSFTEEQKGWVLEAFEKGASHTTETFKAQEAELIDTFANDYGIRIVEPDIQAFRDHAAEYYASNPDITADWNWDYYDALQEY